MLLAKAGGLAAKFVKERIFDILICYSVRAISCFLQRLVLGISTVLVW